MLNKIFYKVDSDGKKKKMTDKEILGMFCVTIVLIVLALVLAFVASNKVKEEKNKSINIAEVFETINDNYSIEVVKILNGEESKVVIDCTTNVCVYSSDVFEHKEIFKYNDKYYTISNYDTFEKSNVVETTDQGLSEKFNSLYYDLNLIKSIIEVTKKVDFKDNVINANTTLERYLKENNYKFEKILKTEEDIEIPIKLTINGYAISVIEVDYKAIDKYFNNTDHEELKYKITVKGINNNDFQAIEDYFKEA